jgi:hypothetical protein
VVLGESLKPLLGNTLPGTLTHAQVSQRGETLLLKKIEKCIAALTEVRGGWIVLHLKLREKPQPKKKNLNSKVHFSKL